MFTSIVAILLSFKPSVYDKGESLEERTQRFTVLAHAIESAADRITCVNQTGQWEPGEHPKGCKPLYQDRYLVAGILMAQVYRESALRRDVWIGVCLHKWDCDYGEAKGPWQLQQRTTDTDEEWQAFAGPELPGLKKAAWRTITLWIGGATQGGDPTCGFARLAGYPQCEPGHYGDDRWKLAQSLANKLRRK
jgi:hypothetical protein